MLLFINQGAIKIGIFTLQTLRKLILFSRMVNLKNHTNVALGYFLLVGLLGIFLRLFFVTSIPANFRYVVHAHSHIALLGWVYIALTTLIYKLYLTDAGKDNIYRRIFLFTQVTLIGMLIAFPIQGYALFSIIFSTLFLFASYFFTWFVFKNVPDIYRNTYSFRCIRAALWYMVISSIGPWAIAVVMVTLGNTSIWYKLSIYFYLHFQYNAWFILALCGILFYILEKAKVFLTEKDFNFFFRYINYSIILTFFLSTLWVEPPIIFYILAGAGAILQFPAFFRLFNLVSRNWRSFGKKISSFNLFLLKIIGFFLLVKIVLQALTTFPYFATLSFNYIDFVVGYLHWVFLGIISISLFFFLQQFNLLRLPRKVFWIYFAGLVLSELLIFYKGIAIWLGLPFFSDYFLLLTSVSSLIPVSVAILLVKNLNNPKYS